MNRKTPKDQLGWNPWEYSTKLNFLYMAEPPDQHVRFVVEGTPAPPLLQGSIPCSKGCLFSAGTYSKRTPTAAAWLGHDLQGSWKQEIPKQWHRLDATEQRHNDLREKIQWVRGLWFPLSVFIVDRKHVSLTAVLYVISITCSWLAKDSNSF